MQSRIKKLDFILIGFSIIALILVGDYFLNILSPNADYYGTKGFDPFYKYDTNKGIILIQTVNFILWLGILLIGVAWTIKKNIDYKWVYVIFALCILLFISRWVEFWYGSTFYYGEIRDKQGLTFPIFRLCLVFYAIWRFKLELIDKKQIIIKTIVSILTTLLFLGFYIAKYDVWTLGIS